MISTKKTITLLPSQRFEAYLRAEHSYMEFYPSMGRLVRFSRGGRARFYVNVPNHAPIEIEAAEGIEMVCKQILHKV